jgi:hypothetical protein
MGAAEDKGAAALLLSLKDENPGIPGCTLKAGEPVGKHLYLAYPGAGNDRLLFPQIPDKRNRGRRRDKADTDNYDDFPDCKNRILFHELSLPILGYFIWKIRRIKGIAKTTYSISSWIFLDLIKFQIHRKAINAVKT